jgi:alkanesulfonate monooxygenase SsuD/methylene tetrahydromethanopterin reductase-like flavin-dependent oxidoreductase (luciferase family)
MQSYLTTATPHTGPDAQSANRGQRLWILNAFDMSCAGHQSPGLWKVPGDRSKDYHTISYWQDVAKLLERGKFHGIFIADVLGSYDVKPYGAFKYDAGDCLIARFSAGTTELPVVLA